MHKFYIKNLALEIKGGRKESLKKLQDLDQFKDFAKNRVYPSIPTTRISAYLKFGTLSIREAYHRIA